MSGPKESDYYISPAEQRRQEEERRQRLEEERRRLEEERRRQEELKCQALESEICALWKKLDSVSSTISSEADAKVNEAKSLYSASLGIDNLEKVASGVLSSIDTFPRSYGSRISHNMESYRMNLSKTVKEVDAFHNGEFSEAIDMIVGEMKESRTATAENDFLSKSYEVKRKNISLKSTKAEQVKTILQDDSHLVELEFKAFQALLQPYLWNDDFVKRNELEELQQSVLLILANKKLDSEYKITQIKMRAKAFMLTKDKFDQEIIANQKVHAEFDQLYSTYLALCSMLDVEPRNYVFDSGRAFQSIDELRQEVDKRKTELTKKEEADYIAESINEVMAEMGYDIVASDFMTTPKRSIIHNVYEFERGNIINAFTSDNGSLMFEVSGVKENDKDLNSQDKLKIKESMESFCSKYPEIKKRLKSRGIELKSEILKPPDEKYAKAVDLSKKGKPSEKQRKRKKASPQGKTRTNAVS